MNEDPLRPPNDQSNLNWIFYLNSIILFAQNQLTTCYWRRVIECYSRKKALCTFIRRSNQPTSERDDQYGRVLPWPRIKREWLLHLFTISDEAAAAAATDPHTESSLGVGLCVASPLSLLTHFFFFSLCDYYYYSPSPLVFLGLVLVLLPVLVLFVNDDHHCSHWRSLYATTPHREISHSLARSIVPRYSSRRFADDDDDDRRMTGLLSSPAFFLFFSGGGGMQWPHILHTYTVDIAKQNDR